MSTITTRDGTHIFYKDWGPRDAQPVVFHHGWPLSADDWDNQMLFFLAQGFRVIAHDRRGHGRSSQSPTGHEMDTYAADVAALTDALDLKNAIHIGHSTGGGEATRYVARAKPGRVAKAIIVGAVPPVHLQDEGVGMDVAEEETLGAGVDELDGIARGEHLPLQRLGSQVDRRPTVRAGPLTRAGADGTTARRHPDR